MNAGSIGSKTRQLQLWSLRICFQMWCQGLWFWETLWRLARVFCGSFHVTCHEKCSAKLSFALGKFILEESLPQTQSKRSKAFRTKFVWSWSNWSSEASNAFFPIATAKGSGERRAVIKHCLQRLSSKTAQLSWFSFKTTLWNPVQLCSWT